jgi:nucleoside-diphosphate-sugar epimerase
MNVLVTGADGYIGVPLVQTLGARGHHVVPLDTGFYADGWLYDGAPRLHCRRRDVRQVDERDLTGFDAVVHLAELSNDPLGQHRPEVTYRINHAGSRRLARLARRAGVRRFVYSSSCSVYGAGVDGWLTEESPTQPLTAYAECKLLVERDVAALADDGFCPTFLRNATAYGASPRMRFDLVLNNLAGLAWTTRRIAMVSDGSPWRPLVHVRDIGEAMAEVLEAPIEAVHNQTFNVGENDANYRVKEIAEIVAEAFPGCALTFGAPSGDQRSYRVSFDKIHERLPGFRCSRNAWDGARELRAVFESVGLSADVFQFRAFTRLAQLQHLLATGQIDDDFFWRVAAERRADAPERRADAPERRADAPERAA